MPPTIQKRGLACQPLALLPKLLPPHAPAALAGPHCGRYHHDHEGHLPHSGAHGRRPQRAWHAAFVGFCALCAMCLPAQLASPLTARHAELILEHPLAPPPCFTNLLLHYERQPSTPNPQPHCSPSTPSSSTSASPRTAPARGRCGWKNQRCSSRRSCGPASRCARGARSGASTICACGMARAVLLLLLCAGACAACDGMRRALAWRRVQLGFRAAPAHRFGALVQHSSCAAALAPT